MTARKSSSRRGQTKTAAATDTSAKQTEATQKDTTTETTTEITPVEPVTKETTTTESKTVEVTTPTSSDEPEGESVDTSELTASGKAFYKDAVVGFGVDYYSAERIVEAYLNGIDSPALVASRLSDFITRGSGATLDDRNYALGMFKNMMAAIGRFDDAQFTKAMKALAEFVGNDIRVGGYFSKEAAIAPLRGDAGCASMFMLLKRLVPSAKRKELAEKTNYSQAATVFRDEHARNLLESVFK